MLLNSLLGSLSFPFDMTLSRVNYAESSETLCCGFDIIRAVILPNLRAETGFCRNLTSFQHTVEQNGTQPLKPHPLHLIPLYIALTDIVSSDRGLVQKRQDKKDSLRMSSQQPEPAISPPPVPVSPPTGVRRHHTISASSRRPGARAAISEEDHDQEHWNDDEVVDEDWVGGVGVVGEKSSLHRQSSLPTRYHRGKFLRLSCLHLLTKSYFVSNRFHLSVPAFY